MVRHVRNTVRAFDYCTSCQAEHENRSLKAPGGTKPQQNIHRSALAMVNKPEHRYQVKASVSGRAIATTQLWSTSITAQLLTRIAEGLRRAQVTSNKNYFVKSMGQLLFFVVDKIVELNSNAIPGGRPQIVGLRVVQFEVDGSVCCSCYFLKAGIASRHILAIFHNLDEHIIDFHRRATLGFYFGNPMYARATSVIIQALESSLKKDKASIPPHEICYPVYSNGEKESCFSPFFNRGAERIFLTKSKYPLHQSVVTECNGQGLDASSFYVDDEDSSDEEMENNQFVGDKSLDASEFHSRLLADTASRRKIKAREAFTVLFHFLCDYADQSDEHMSFIEKKLEILKGEIALCHEKSQQVPDHSKGERLACLASCSVPLEKNPELGPGGKPINMDDVVK
jgi:hypothetical protein